MTKTKLGIVLMGWNVVVLTFLVIIVGIIAWKMTPKKVTKEITVEVPRVERIQQIYFVDKNTVSKLPHCALNWDYSENRPYNDEWCSDTFTDDEIVIKKVKP